MDKSKILVLGILISGLVASASALGTTQSDLSVTIQEPTEDENLSVSDWSNEIPVELDIENTNADNDTYGAVNLTFTDSTGATDEVTVNDNLTVASSSTETVTYYYDASDLETGTGWSVQAEYDSEDGYTVSDTVNFEFHIYSLMQGVFIPIVIILLMLAVVGSIANKENL